MVLERLPLYGKISLAYYYNPGKILIEHDVDIMGIVILFSITAVLLAAAVIYFQRRDIAVV